MKIGVNWGDGMQIVELTTILLTSLLTISDKIVRVNLDGWYGIVWGVSRGLADRAWVVTIRTDTGSFRKVHLVCEI